MDKKRIDDIRARADAASPGPWVYFHKRKYEEHHVGVPSAQVKPFSKIALFSDGCPTGSADAEFIAHARQDVPYLLDIIAGMRLCLLGQCQYCVNAKDDEGNSCGRPDCPDGDYWELHPGYLYAK
ncbi:MAG: hypothetical protein FWB91_00230 [Defluviitaleaceae bacterium]|nr:hypothetical protein [Defluviitaleaceae bacterium]